LTNSILVNPTHKRVPSKAKPSRTVLVKCVLVMSVFVVAGWFLWQHFRACDFVNYPPSATGPWVAFGDSLTEGFGATEGNDYPAVLSQKLGIKIINLGKAGETTGDGLKRVEAAAALRPRVVLLCMGGNDVLQKIPREEMFNNLSALIDRFHREGSFVVLIGLRSATVLDKNHKFFKAFAREKQVFYVRDILDGIFMKPVYMSDAVHPNDEGYRLVAERLDRELRPMLGNLGR
jgi:acyl-CoA thioesterase I